MKELPINQIICGDALTELKKFPNESVDCVICSPPYWGLRMYIEEGKPEKRYELGLEKTPEEFVAKMVEVFREVKRVLKKEGTLWLNLGDSYAMSSMRGENSPFTGLVDQSKQGIVGIEKQIPSGLKPKDLCGIPWRVAFALQADGWWLRQDIVWGKTNPMPESVTDRCTKSHEYIFLLTKSPNYYFDNRAIREGNNVYTRKGVPKLQEAVFNAPPTVGHNRDGLTRDITTIGHHKRSVWTITTKPFKEAHFATFPEDLIVPMVLAGTSEKGVCPDCGKSWERVLERGRLVGTGGSDVAKLSGNKSSNLRNDNNKLYNYEKITIGWQPTCKCYGVEIIPEQPAKPSKLERIPRWEIEVAKWQGDWERLNPIYKMLKTVSATVLDPFIGSGTTGLVAKKLGRNYIGIELNPKYVAMAERRIGKQSERLI